MACSIRFSSKVGVSGNMRAIIRGPEKTPDTAMFASTPVLATISVEISSVITLGAFHVATDTGLRDCRLRLMYVNMSINTMMNAAITTKTVIIAVSPAVLPDDVAGKAAASSNGVVAVVFVVV